jgi:hypothetical protein
VKSLFLRIFLWVWAAMLAVVVVLIVTSPVWTRSRPGVERWQRGAARSWSRLEEAAVERAANPEATIDRPPAFRASAGHVARQRGRVARPVDRSVRELAATAGRSSEVGDRHLLTDR